MNAAGPAQRPSLEKPEYAAPGRGFPEGSTRILTKEKPDHRHR
jgi:hypothetical protein